MTMTECGWEPRDIKLDIFAFVYFVVWGSMSVGITYWILTNFLGFSPNDPVTIEFFAASTIMMIPVAMFSMIAVGLAFLFCWIVVLSVVVAYHAGKSYLSGGHSE